MNILRLAFCLFLIGNFTSRGQNKEQDTQFALTPWDITIGLGIGNKSHLGNFGVTSDLYFTKNIGLKVSAGVAPFNFGGGVISFGPEASFLYHKKGFLSLGALWSYQGEGSDVLGDDDTSDHVWYKTSYVRSLKFYLGYCLNLERGAFLKFEAGYSHALTNPAYSFLGPGIATQEQKNQTQRGLSSGWMASVYVNLVTGWGKKQRQR